MKYEKGDPNHPSKTGKLGRRAGYGRQKGTPNKKTVELRAFFELFTQQNQDKLEAAFKRLLQNEPGEALRVFGAFAEFVIPKLQRTEHADADGNKLPPPVFNFQFPTGAPGLPAPGGVTVTPEGDVEEEAASREVH